MKRTINLFVCVAIATILLSCNGGKRNEGAIQKTDTVACKQDTISCIKDTEATKKDTVASKRNEEAPKFSAKNMVGVWDYYADPNNKIEIIFKKDGTLVDFIDFHTTGTYNVNPEGTILTFRFFYNDGETSEKSKPYKFNIIKYASNKFTIKSVKGGDPIHYERKAKSMNSTDEL